MKYKSITKKVIGLGLAFSILPMSASVPPEHIHAEFGFGPTSAVGALEPQTSLPEEHNSSIDGEYRQLAVENLPTDPQIVSPIPNHTRELVDRVYQSVAVSSFVWNAEKQTLEIWLEPDSDIALVNAIASNSEYGNVQIEYARFSTAQIDDAIASLMEVPPLPGMEVAWAAPNANRSGINISPTRPQRLRTGSQLSSIDGIPVTLQEPSTPMYASRDNSLRPPFIAGARMIRYLGNNTTTSCSTSFAVRNLATGAGGLLTADHCARNTPNMRAWRTGNSVANQTLGLHPATLPRIWNDWGDPNTTDVTILSGGSYAPAMYFGSPTASQFAPVTGSTPPIIGDLVAYNGQPSGTVWQNRITDTNLWVIYSRDLAYRNIVRTVQIDGLPANGNGDSGGPVFAVAPTGGALAVGVISGIENRGRVCAGTPHTPGARYCSSTAFFAPITAYLVHRGYRIETW